jgi:hypothetical protein
LDLVEFAFGQWLRKYRADMAAGTKAFGVFRDQGIVDRMFHAGNID